MKTIIGNVDTLKPKQFIAKWGFGMAPISTRMRQRYDNAVQTGLNFLESRDVDVEVNIDDFSELKGMFNRCLRQDQWDWFSVFEELGHPDRKFLRSIPSGLVDLRRAVKDDKRDLLERIRERLIRSNLLTYLYHYQGTFVESPDFDYGWLYILSAKQQPDVLKIGMTNRSVQQRIKEINAATGVLYPLSARKIFRVSDAKNSEQEVFELLKEFRLRPDREFFSLPYPAAARLIEGHLMQNRLCHRQRGHIVWFDPEKSFGFIKSLQQDEDVFFHRSEVLVADLPNLQTDTQVEFEVGLSLRGRFAFGIRIISCQDTLPAE